MGLRTAARGIGYHDVKYLLLIIAVMAFFLGLMLMDYGASFKDLRGIVAFQSLMFDSIDPRIVYHLGLLLTIISFIVTQSIAFHYVVKDSRRCPLCHT